MKKIILILVFPLWSISLQAQQQGEFNPVASSYTNYYHSFRDISISLSPNLLVNTPNGTQLAGGLKLRMFLGKRISFDSDLMLGRNYMHVGPGILGLPIWYIASGNFSQSSEYDPFIESGSSTFSELLIMGALMLMSVEHTAYHIPAGKDLDISPYISALRFRQLTDHDYSTEQGLDISQSCFALGLEVNKYFGSFVLSPYIEYNIGYQNHTSAFYCGVYCGFYIPNRL